MVGNVTGWNELVSGDIISAAYTLYDVAFNGWFIAIIFFTFQFLLYTKTKNLTITWVMGLLFAGLYTSTAFMNEFSRYILFISLVFQLAGIFYFIFFKKDPESGI